MREPEGFREYVAARQSALVHRAWLLTGDWQHAEDLVQATLVKVWPHWGRIVRRGEPEAYVRTAMVRQYISSRRRHWHRETPTEVVPEPPRPPAESTTDDVGCLLAELPARQRLAVVLRYYDDLSVEQAASLMNCPPGTVKSLTSRGLARLRDAYAKEHS